MATVAVAGTFISSISTSGGFALAVNLGGNFDHDDISLFDWSLVGNIIYYWFLF